MNLPLAVLLLAPAVRGSAEADLLQTWWHDNAEPQAVRPVAPNNVRQSDRYGIKVALASSPSAPAPGLQWERSFTYMSTPRSSAAKRGYATVDGAEYASGAALTMSWSSFVYGADVWVSLSQLSTTAAAADPRHAHPVVLMEEEGDSATVRPRRVAADVETKLLDDGSTGIRIPHRPGGYRLSIEFDAGLFDTYNDGTSCCNLTDR